MARHLLASLLLAGCLALAGCGGSDGATQTPTTTPKQSQAATPALSGQSGTPVPLGSPGTPTPTAGPRWAATLTGPISDKTTTISAPDCQMPSGFAVTLGGKLAGGGVITVTITGTPGTYDLASHYETRPTIDVRIPGVSFGEWSATVGTSGSGHLTIQPNGGGSIDATLPNIIGSFASNDALHIAGAWTCA